ncbi:uncharacterized protein MONBRDRAFT_12602 [Monosiga brevicollis MX1]|uniref:HMG box domain-containing protein n=1 Tax=Monosiga brevicollis TaxID=81824 RepID=A9VCR9_MONBE|nr:uncharacterized protein MONBRDRAFT_12602 [Monosiga brevicollis MX1]EDQ84732.1 predicted protein [Monosiga brevicollis MX1]|eukprot:XP_001750518.1 hypothetical protein [Monosiga brevicollis MX1]
MAKDRPKTTTKVRGKPTTQPAPKAAKAPRGAKAPAKATKATKAPAKTTKAAKAPAKTTKAAKAPAKTAKGAKAPAKTAKAAKGTKATKAAKAAPVASLEPMDPGVKVKRPLNSFMIFAKDQRAVLRQTHPNLHHSELSKLIGTSWNELSSEDRAIYQQRADQLKQEHQALYPNYRSVGPGQSTASHSPHLLLLI